MELYKNYIDGKWLASESKDIIQETAQVDEMKKEYNEYKEEKGKE